MVRMFLTPLSPFPVEHFTSKREVAMYLLISSSNLTKIGSNCDSGLTRFDGRVHLIIYCLERVRKSCQRDTSAESCGSERVPLCHELRGDVRCDWIQT